MNFLDGGHTMTEEVDGRILLSIVFIPIEFVTVAREAIWELLFVGGSLAQAEKAQNQFGYYRSGKRQNI